MKNLFDMLNALALLSPELTAYLQSILVPMTIKKGQYLLREGEYGRYVYFIAKGMICLSYSSEDGEMISFILKEGGVVVSPEGVFAKETSLHDIWTMEDTEVWYITDEQLDDICRKFPEFLWHRLWLTQHYYLMEIKMNYMNRRKTSLEKFQMMMTIDPELFSRVRPKKYLYSYFNTSKTSFKRMYDKYIGKNSTKKKK